MGPDPLAQHFARQLEQANTARRAKYEEEVARHEAGFSSTPGNVSAYLALAKCHRSFGRVAEAVAVLERARIGCRPSGVLYNHYIKILSASGCAAQAVDVATEAVQCLPNDLLLKFQERLLLPALYETREEVAAWRTRFTEGLDRLAREVRLDTAEERASALEAVKYCNPFYLSYQGCDDRELWRRYGELIHRIVVANHPQWAQPPVVPAVGGERLRVGFVSGCFWNHTVGRLFLGWFENAPHDVAEICCFQIGGKSDEVTLAYRRAADRFDPLPDDLEAVAARIRAERLHIIVHLDVGMSPMSRLLAALRLAPVQCAAWGHPVTTGLPTIDYFLSAAAMEPPRAEEHYTETLVPLPGIGISVKPTVIPRALLSSARADFNLREDAVVFFCGQTLSKYLPAHDHVFAAIATKCPDAQFVFLSENSLLAENLRSRLAGHFHQAGLDPAAHLVMIPRQNLLSYWNLNLLSDVFLDSFAWSGGRTTLDALACGLPIVTCPGEFMRGRQSYGMLRTMGVTETVVADEASYVELAARLGRDPHRRAEIVQRLRRESTRLYGNTEGVSGLYDFLRRAAGHGGAD